MLIEGNVPGYFPLWKW